MVLFTSKLNHKFANGPFNLLIMKSSILYYLFTLILQMVAPPVDASAANDNYSLIVRDSKYGDQKERFSLNNKMVSTDLGEKIFALQDSLTRVYNFTFLDSFSDYIKDFDLNLEPKDYEKLSFIWTIDNNAKKVKIWYLQDGEVIAVDSMPTFSTSDWQYDYVSYQDEELINEWLPEYVKDYKNSKYHIGHILMKTFVPLTNEIINRKIGFSDIQWNETEKYKNDIFNYNIVNTYKKVILPNIKSFLSNRDSNALMPKAVFKTFAIALIYTVF